MNDNLHENCPNYCLKIHKLDEIPIPAARKTIFHLFLTTNNILVHFGWNHHSLLESSHLSLKDL